jgi:predicted dehydrogenase
MNEKTKIVTYIIIGAGNRGNVYSLYALENPTFAKVIGVVEPNECKRNLFIEKHKETILKENIFVDWKEMAKREKFADAVVVTTPDNLHAEIVITFAKKGYHILVEKPMGITERECIDITETVKKSNIIFAVGHVMRYTPYTKKN